MLAQQISAVIVAVGRAHDDVNMIFVMLFVLGEGLAGLMIELDQQHRAMDAVIENAVFFHAAEHAEFGFDHDAQGAERVELAARTKAILNAATEIFDRGYADYVEAQSKAGVFAPPAPGLPAATGAS